MVKLSGKEQSISEMALRKVQLPASPLRAPAAVASAFNSSFNSVTVDAAGVLRAAGSETDLIAIEFA